MHCAKDRRIYRQYFSAAIRIERACSEPKSRSCGVLSNCGEDKNLLPARRFRLVSFVAVRSVAVIARSQCWFLILLPRGAIDGITRLHGSGRAGFSSVAVFEAEQVVESSARKFVVYS